MNRSVPFPPYRDDRERNDETGLEYCDLGKDGDSRELLRKGGDPISKCPGGFCRQSPGSKRRVTMGIDYSRRHVAA